MGSIGAPELMAFAVFVAFVAALVAAVFAIVRRVRRIGYDLVACRACSRRISPRAVSCPTCGEPA